MSRSMEYKVGQRVRVAAVDGCTSRRATVALRNDDNSDCKHHDSSHCTYDIIYDVAINSNGSSSDVKAAIGGKSVAESEEAAVHCSRISPLMDFEVTATEHLEGKDDDIEAEDYKLRGNSLFAAKDYEAATEQYLRGIEKLLATAAAVASKGTSSSNNSRSINRSNNVAALTIGAAVLLQQPKSLNYQPGIVSDITAVDSSTGVATAVDVIFDDDSFDEATAVSVDHIVLLASSSSGQRSLQRVLLLNTARCDLKRQRRGWAIQRASCALAIAQQQQQENDASMQRKSVADCLYFRGMALLAASRPRLAKRDCRELALLDSSRAEALEKEISVLQQQIAKSNRRLARDVASWVDTAMRNSGSANSSSSIADRKTSAADDDDLPFAPDDDCDSDNSKDYNNLSSTTSIAVTTAASFAPPMPPSPRRNYGSSPADGKVAKPMPIPRKQKKQNNSTAAASDAESTSLFSWSNVMSVLLLLVALVVFNLNH